MVVFPTPERAQHDALVMQERSGDDGSPSYGAVVATQRPLDRYLRRKEITPEQYQVGDDLYALWRRAGMEPRICVDYASAKVDGRSRDDIAEARERARKRYMASVNPLPAPYVSVLVSVCLLGETAGAWAVSTNRYHSSGLDYLRDALDAVAKGWGRS